MMTHTVESFGPFRVVRETGLVSLTRRRSMLPVLWWSCTAALLLVIPGPLLTRGGELPQGVDLAALPPAVLGVLMIIMATIIGSQERGRGIIIWVRRRLTIRRRSAAPGYRSSPVEPQLTVDGRTFPLADVKRVMVDRYYGAQEDDNDVLPVYLVLPHEVIRVHDLDTEGDARALAQWLCTEIGLDAGPDIGKLTIGPDAGGFRALKYVLQLAGVVGIFAGMMLVAAEPNRPAALVPMALLSCGSLAWGWLLRLILGKAGRRVIADYARSRFGISPR